MAGGITHLLSRCLRLLFLLLWCQKSFCVNCYYSFRVSFTAECDTVCLMRRYFCVAVFFFLHSTKEYFLEGLWSTASPFACHIAIKKKKTIAIGQQTPASVGLGKWASRCGRQNTRVFQEQCNSSTLQSFLEKRSDSSLHVQLSLLKRAQCFVCVVGLYCLAGWLVCYAEKWAIHTF